MAGIGLHFRLSKHFRAAANAIATTMMAAAIHWLIRWFPPVRHRKEGAALRPNRERRSERYRAAGSSDLPAAAAVVLTVAVIWGRQALVVIRSGADTLLAKSIETCRRTEHRRADPPRVAGRLEDG